MSNHQSQVLALKYRPKSFDDIVGQPSISKTLSSALDSDRLSHAYLLSGLRGSGKTSTARIMAKCLLCDNAPTSKPCGVCDNCKAFQSGEHIDMVEMDAASNRGIDDIKELIEHTKYKPLMAKYKVFIIDEIHMLTNQAFNAILKTLEEPPEFVKFILATTDPLKLPATILSRVQHFRFKPISINDIIKHIKHILNIENIEYEQKAIEAIARNGHGSLRDTLTILDQSIIYTNSNIRLSLITDMLGLLDIDLIDDIFDTILNDKDIIDTVGRLNTYETEQILDEISIYLKDKMIQNDPKFNTIMYDRFFRIIADSKYLLSINSDDGFVLILTLMKFKEAVKLKSIDSLILDIEQIKVSSANNNNNLQVLSTNKPQQALSNQELYQKVIQKVYDRNIDLGDCFKKSFIFSSFNKESKIIFLDSFAQGECKKMLWRSFKDIRMFIEDIFGIGVKIEFNKKVEQEKKI